MDALERVGQIPLPPYIDRSGEADGKPTQEDAARYQTVYAKNPGAVAAPTAGLHFTPAVDAALDARGVGVCEITLNVGPGTFRPIKEENLDKHAMHSEWYNVPDETWRRVAETKRAGGRVVAVGTTTARTLEAAASTGERAGWTEIFIRPGYDFKIIDGLVTNFHLPGSSLLVMISALAGRERVLDCYGHAVRGEWRFYSYGDAMLIWKRE
jgi:S-adenosylmethionine:tRNA ribosyltransferase-isomerase